jgi:hypothetical protein
MAPPSKIKFNAFARAAIAASGLMGLMGLLGCDSTKIQNSTASSSHNNTIQGAAAECNQINGTGLTGYLSSFWNPQSQSYVDDLARLRFTSVPVGLTTTGTQYMQIIRWHINDSNGTRVFQTSPVGIIFIVRQTGEYLNGSAPVTQISKATINNAISTFSLSSRGITTDNFFQHIMMVVNGITNTDDALAFAFYDSSAGPQAQTQVYALLAPYLADPYKYRQQHPWPNLYDLHPLNSMSPGLNEADYVAAANNFCTGFL